MALRGIRGATTVENDTREEIVGATRALLSEMVSANGVEIPDIASVIFSVTKDLKAEFPAAAARDLGWNDAPLLCTYEIDVPGSLQKCIRILMHVNTEKPQKEMKHVYLKEARSLRR